MILELYEEKINYILNLKCLFCREMKVGGRFDWDVQGEWQEGVGVDLIKVYCILYEIDKKNKFKISSGLVGRFGRQRYFYCYQVCCQIWWMIFVYFQSLY